MSLNFNDKVVVVTGAGNGLGRSHALLFAALGARVVVNDLGGSGTGEGSDANVPDSVVAEIKASGGDAVANPDSVTNGDKIIQCAMDHFGQVDIVINNAGILRDKSFHKMSDDDWDLVPLPRGGGPPSSSSRGAGAAMYLSWMCLGNLVGFIDRCESRPELVVSAI